MLCYAVLLIVLLIFDVAAFGFCLRACLSATGGEG